MVSDVGACEMALGGFSLGDTCPSACVRALSGAANATKACMGVSGASVGMMVEELVQSVAGYCDGVAELSERQT